MNTLRHRRSVRFAAAALGFCLLGAATPGLAAPKEKLMSMLKGPGAEVDPQFAYYAHRSAESIASEVKANGYKHVHYIAVADSDIRADLIRAFHKEGLPVWYLTFCHVSYNTKDFPAGWESWRMKLRASPGNDFTRLCMNNPGYTAFKRRQIGEVMRKFPFDGVELVEPFWPDVPGPESATYGCLCDNCRAAFAREYPGEEMPEFTDAASPRYYKKQPKVYKDWVDFRTKSIGRFLANAVADARRERPGVPVMAWTLAQDEPNAVAFLREAQGNDAATMAKVLKPDAICFQTNWTDWSKSDLPPDYVRAYQPFLDHLRAAAPGMPVTIQVDTGSLKPSRQTYPWLFAADRAAQSMGALGTVNYEYYITKSMYDDPPRLAWVRPRAGGITLVFQKRVDAGRAGDPTNYRVTDARGQSLTITGAKPDGNQVLLGVRGIKPGTRYTVRIAETTDTPNLWLFKGYPAHTVKGIRKAFTVR